MDWFRSYHGAPLDPKLAVIAKRAKARRGDVAAVWWCLLDHASQAGQHVASRHDASQNVTSSPDVTDAKTAQIERGSIALFDVEAIALALDFEEETVAAILAAMRDKGMIDPDDKLANWEKRQPKREDSSADRTRAYRERKRGSRDDGDDPKRDVTHGDAAVTQGDTRGEEIRREKKDSSSNTESLPREEEGDGFSQVQPSNQVQGSARAVDPATAFIALFDEVRVAVFGPAQARPWPHGTDLATARQWMELGIDAALLRAVLEAKCRKREAKGERPPDTLSFFNRDVADAVASGKAPMPAPRPASKTQGQSAPFEPSNHPDSLIGPWRIRLKQFFKSGFWMAIYGTADPMSDDCEAYRRFPELREEFATMRRERAEARAEALT